MHSINNGYSLEKKRDNWMQIATYLKKISNLNLKIDNIDALIKNENNEILSFIIQLYQELTKKKIPQIEGKKISTDVDEVNKTFLLKETGEIELLKKDLRIIEKPEEVQKTMKSVATVITTQKTSSMIMKGEMKVISNNISNVDNKNFRLKISEAKTFERSTKLIREIKDNQQSNIYSPKLRNDGKGEDTSQNYVQLKINNESTREEDPKLQKMNPFDRLEDIISQKTKTEFKAEFENLQADKTVVEFLKNVNSYSYEFLGMLLSEINKIVDEYYNLMTTHVNEYVTLFYALMEAYLNKEIDNKKFHMIHECLNTFFIKSLKIRSDEIIYIFKYIFIPKIFESIRNLENRKIIYPLCELIYKILDPVDKQLVEFFKLFKENVEDEVILYECFSHLHDMLLTYPENLIDVCLFYVLNGISHINSDVRYHSLYILYKYANINLNFFHNLEKKLEKLSRREEDKEACLLLIKIACLSFKQAFINKNKPREVKKKSQFFNENDDSSVQQYINEVQIGNSIVRNILPRFTGDSMLTYFIAATVCENLYENTELYKIVLNPLFESNYNIIKCIFYDEDLNPSIKKLFHTTIYRHEPRVPSKINTWNYSYFLLAFDMIVSEKYGNNFLDKFYEFFVRFIIKNGMNPEENLEIWKNNFKFLKFVIEDCKSLEKINRSLGLLEYFILCEPISRQVFEECYDHIFSLTIQLGEKKTEINMKLIDIIGKKLRFWNSSNAVSSILKEGLRKLIENINQ
jgi:hypothetical protein